MFAAVLLTLWVFCAIIGMLLRAKDELKFAHERGESDVSRTSHN